MKTIPMKVETKMMAFEDSAATAPDRITGQKNIVAFRALSLKNGQSSYSTHNSSDQGFLLLMGKTLKYDNQGREINVANLW